MMNDKILALEKSIANIKANITIIETGLNGLKEKESELSCRLDISNQDITNINKDIYKIKVDYSKELERLSSDLVSLEKEVISLKEQMDVISITVSKINNKLERLETNSLLAFTSELTFKKVVIIISFLVSIAGSPSAASFVWDTLGPNEADKLELIIKLLEENPSQKQSNP